MGVRGAIAFQTLHMQQGLNPLVIEYNRQCNYNAGPANLV